MGTTTLDPGRQTTLEVAMMMHPGMDGPHLFRIILPVDNGGERADLEMYVRADFR